MSNSILCLWFNFTHCLQGLDSTKIKIIQESGPFSLQTTTSFYVKIFCYGIWANMSFTGFKNVKKKKKQSCGIMVLPWTLTKVAKFNQITLLLVAEDQARFAFYGVTVKKCLTHTFTDTYWWRHFDFYRTVIMLSLRILLFVSLDMVWLL